MWDEAMQDQMQPENGDGIDEVKDNLTFEWIEDKEALEGKDMDNVRR
jgi:hypothetical protein